MWVNIPDMDAMANDSQQKKILPLFKVPFEADQTNRSVMRRNQAILFGSLTVRP